MRHPNRNYIDVWYAGAFFLLILAGIIMVYSASAYYAERVYGDPQLFLKKHLFALFIGLFGMTLAYKFPYRRLQGWTWVLMWMSLAMLVYLAFIHRGRWIYIGPLNFQVVDVAKFSLIFFLADSLSRKENILKNYSEGLFPHLVYIFLFAFLVLRQPDFSSAALLVLLSLSILFVSPIKIRHLVFTGLAAIPLAAIAVIISPYKLARVEAFLNPQQDLQGKGYQIYQSLISFGNGGIDGVGFAQSKQKLFFLPEAHTDFIFSIVGEEWGLIGTLFLVLLFCVIMARGIKVARYTLDRFSFYLSVGITANFVLYSMVHMMVTLHLLPPTGLPMPFVSYGGTSLLFSCIYAGFLLNIARETFSEVSEHQRQFTLMAVSNFNNRRKKIIR